MKNAIVVSERFTMPWLIFLTVIFILSRYKEVFIGKFRHAKIIYTAIYIFGYFMLAMYILGAIFIFYFGYPE